MGWFPEYRKSGEAGCLSAFLPLRRDGVDRAAIGGVKSPVLLRSGRRLRHHHRHPALYPEHPRRRRRAHTAANAAARVHLDHHGIPSFSGPAGAGHMAFWSYCNPSAALLQALFFRGRNFFLPPAVRRRGSNCSWGIPATLGIFCFQFGIYFPGSLCYSV